MKDQDRSDKFHAQWMSRLDDLLPVPCIALGALIVLGSAAPWRSAALILVYIGFNVSISAMAKADLGVSYFGPARQFLCSSIFVVLAWVSGPESPAWILAMVGLFGAVFSRSGVTQLGSILNFIAAAMLGAYLAGYRGLWFWLVPGTLASIAWLSSGLARVLFGTWLSAQVNAEALGERAEDMERALATRQTFLATMSHEVRTPLNGVLGMAELLAETPLSIEQRTMLETIHDSGEGLLQVLNDILDTAKLDAGKISLETLPFNPAQLAGSVCRLLGTKSEGRPVDLRIEVDPSVPMSISGTPHACGKFS